jgi:hypothetical protein
MARRRPTAIYRPTRPKRAPSTFRARGQTQINAGNYLTPQAKQYVQSHGQKVLYPPSGSRPTPSGAPQGRPAPAQPYQLPIDPTYDATVAGLNRNYDISQGDLGYQETALRQQAGFDDLSNPYSQARLLEQSYHQNQNRTTNSMASQGQLYSGALQTGLDYGTGQYNQNLDKARRSYQDQLHALSVQRQQAGADKATGLGMAGADRLTRAQQTPAEDPAPQSAPTSQRQQLMGFGAKRVTGLGGGRWRVLIGGKTVVVRYVNGQWKRA